jgi:molecular chaperone DnaK
MAAYNKKLGTFELMGLPPAPRGIPQIEVTFDIDANGIVNVSAKDLATSKVQSMTITGGSGLSKDEINRMMSDAESHAEEDAKRRETAEVRNAGESLVYQTEKFLKDNESSIPEEGKSNVEGPLADLKKALEGEDLQEISTLMEKVAQASQALGAAMYAQAQQNQASSESAEGDAGSTSSSTEDEVIDAEVVEEDDK